MAYSSIVPKKCKCSPDCKSWPSIGFEGYYADHHPDPTFKQRKIDQAAERRKNRIAGTNAGDKLRRENIVDNTAGKKWDLLQIWFKNIRKKLTGHCQCGCNKPSSKYDDKYFKFSCCHVFPKEKFHSVETHPHNFVERAFWGGCHTNLDEQGMDKWPLMADWENIKEIFHELAPLLTDEERATKFYSNFEKLVYTPTLH